MKQRVLFVDDEKNLLDGLRRMLRPKRDSWEMAFAVGAEEALNLLDGQTFDVIVSDMKMPGMDGAVLFERAKSISPNSARIILSGQSEEEQIFRAIAHCHQFVSKPCEAEDLYHRVESAAIIRNLLPNQEVRDRISRTVGLPCHVGHLSRLREEFERDESFVSTASSIVSSDPGMSAKLLQIANSAFFSRGNVLTDVVQIVETIGRERLKRLVDTGNLFYCEEIEQNVLSIEAFCKHSVQVADTARKIAQLEGFDEHEVQSSYLAGLLHEIGRAILANEFPDQYLEVHELVRSGSKDTYQAELEIFGVGYPEVGAYLLALWGLPSDIVQAVAFHQFPRKSSSELNAITAVHLANVLEGELEPPDSYSAEAGADEDYLSQIATTSNLEEWRNKLNSFKT